MMYVYQSLSESGGYVFGYGETELWAPSDWCQAFTGFWWDQYVSYVQLDLSLITDALYTYLATQAYMDEQRLEEAEAEAYAVSDSIAPAYLYQSSCR